jgi:aldose 1-epimerase
MYETTIETLSYGSWRMEIAPSIGGRIFSLTHHGRDGRRDILRPVPCGEPIAEAIRNAGCYPLVPFSNRIENGRFQVDGRPIALSAHPIAAPHAIHGNGWLAPWTLQDRDDHSVTLGFVHDGGDWPWPFEAQQQFAVDDDGLTVSLSVTPTGPEPMPCGLGFHPYFQRTAGTRLETLVTQHWILRPDCIPVGSEIPHGKHAFAGGPVLPTGLDDGYSGWNREALLHYDDYSVRLTASAALDKLVVYSPDAFPLVCVEPVSHVTNAANLPRAAQADAGWRVLPPGQFCQAWMHIALA